MILYKNVKILKIFFVIFSCFSIMFDIFDPGILICIFKSLISLQRKFLEARFLDFKLRFSFFPKNLQIPESHENPKSQMAPKMDSGIFAVF